MVGMNVIVKWLFPLGVLILSLPAQAQRVASPEGIAGPCRPPVLPYDSPAQRLTIPEAVANGSVSRVGTLPSGHLEGRELTVADLLRDTDVLVMGTISEPRSYLSDDQCDVFSDYPIKDPLIFYHRYPSQTATPRPGPPPAGLSVTQFGGTVTVNGKRFTQKEPSQLRPGAQALLLLQRVGGKYLITRRFYGAFSIAADGQLTPLTEDFAPEYRNVSVSDAVDRMMKLIRTPGAEVEKTSR